MTIEEAIRIAGSRARLASLLGISRQAVHQWGDEVPMLRVYQIRELAALARKRRSRAPLTLPIDELPTAKRRRRLEHE